jgi:hypothetical protein
MDQMNISIADCLVGARRVYRSKPLIIASLLCFWI